MTSYLTSTQAGLIPVKAAPITMGERNRLTLLQLAGFAAMVGYPLYKKFVDKATTVSIGPTLVWLGVGLTAAVYAESQLHCRTVINNPV
jgi:hypothetical protein